MKIEPLAYDSMGVRSMATYVATDQKILIDPGAALGPNRYSLPPHPVEVAKLNELSDTVKKYTEISDILIISHYHFDHYFPYDSGLYRGKVLLIKHPQQSINYSQRSRSKNFLESIKNIPRRIEFADNREFKFNETEIKFSPAAHHGAGNSKLGFVVMASISYKNEKLIHASDIQGPEVLETTDWIIKENPDILILSGYPTLFIGWRFAKQRLLESNKNLIKIMKETKVGTVILDHHLVRDLHYKNKIQDVLKQAKHLKKKVLTAAEFSGQENEFLEARRKELYGE